MRTPKIRSGPAAIAAAAVLLATLRLLAPPPARPATAGPEPARSPEAAAISDMRNVGTAMYSWYMDEQPGRHKTTKAPVPSVEDVTKVPVITRAALEKLLVPKYIKAIPEKDPWGHAYEYRLSQDPDADEVMAIRSAGSGGTFSGNVYHVGAIKPKDTARDLVWKDGYFVRWAARPGK